MTAFASSLATLVGSHQRPADTASGGDKKNCTEALSHQISRLLANELRELGIEGAQAPTSGRDRSFMGGYGTRAC